MKLLTDTFYCATLVGTLSFRCCILRQKQAAVQEYLDCQKCRHGLRNARKFPEFSGESKSVRRWARSREAQAASARRAEKAAMRLKTAMVV